MMIPVTVWSRKRDRLNAELLGSAPYVLKQPAFRAVRDRLLPVWRKRRRSAMPVPGEGKLRMDDETLLAAVWKRFQASRGWLTGGQRGQDDLEQWLASYRRSLATAAHGTSQPCVQRLRHT
jgi:hypothetical protein